MTATRERIERIAVKEALTYPKGTRDYNVAYAACIAALTALCEEMEREKWQSIESAPKDGTEILISGFIQNEPAKGRWVVSCAWNEGWLSCEECGSGYYPPTHWQPLPQPPAT